MKTLIVEDDVTSRLLLQELLRDYGSSQVATNGIEAVAAVSAALGSNDPYNLICLDIMMPEMDGQQALKEIRELESQQGRVAKLGARILMTTALHDKDNIMQSFRAQCDGYLVKPIDKRKLLAQLRELELI
jgi:two-component system chemotaxis response regulator CheY